MPKNQQRRMAHSHHQPSKATVMATKPNPRRANSTRRNRLRARILAAYDTCHICGQPVDKTLTWPHPWCGVVDEIIPISKGGPQTFANTRLAHNYCNRIKSNKSLAWAQHKLQQARAPHQPPARPTSLPFTTSTW